MNRFITLATIFFVSINLINAQSADISRVRKVPFDETTLKKNAIYFSLGAAAQSLIYEVNFANAPRSAWHFKTGIGFNQEIFASNNVHLLAGITYLTGRKRKSHFELNGGAALMFDYDNYRYNQSMSYGGMSAYDFLSIQIIPYMGYRYQKPNGNFIFRYGFGYPEISSISFGLAF